MFTSHWELLVVALVVVLLFGTRRLPELGSGLGQAISNFKKGYREAESIDVTPKKESEPQKTGSTDSQTTQNDSRTTQNKS